MPKRVYVLPPDGRERLEISWYRDYQLLGLRLNGKWIGMISDLRVLEGQQKTFRLRGSILKIGKSHLGSGIRVHLDGQLLTSISTPLLLLTGRSLAISGAFVFLIAGSQVWMGINGFSNIWTHWILGSFTPLLPLVFAGKVPFGVEKISLVLGLLYFFLGFQTWRHSRAALATAITLFSVDTCFWIVMALTAIGGEFGAITVLPIVVGRLFITALLASGFIKSNEADISSLEIHPIRFILGICQQVMRAILITIVIIGAPTTLTFMVPPKRKEK